MSCIATTSAPDARCPSRGGSPRNAARRDLRRIGGPAPWPPDPAQRGRLRAERKVRLQRRLGDHGRGRSRGPGPAALRALEPAETAQVLGIKEKAAGMRYVRALRRLKEILGSLGDEHGDSTMNDHRMSGSDLFGQPGGRVRRSVSPRRAAVADRVRRPISRAGRPDPRAVPRPGGDGAVRRVAPAAARPDHPGSASARSGGPRAAGRIPHPARDRPRAAWASSTRPCRRASAGTWP